MKNPNEFLPSIPLSDFDYSLPDNQIPRFPLEQRDHSRLLVYNKGSMQHHHFYDLPDLLPKDTLLIYNNTKVIPARVLIPLPGSSRPIEVFILKPILPDWTVCECLIGNRKKFKENQILEIQLSNGVIRFEWENREQNIIRITPPVHSTVLESLTEVGKIPLPPYLNREATDSDIESYQTVFANKEGAVAAPTASLHFTNEVLSRLIEKGIENTFITLHVGAGTFKPVKSEYANEHEMHAEQFEINLESLQNIINAKGNIIPVGTTSLRLLESLYYIGVQIILKKPNPFFILPNAGFDPELNSDISLSQSLKSLEEFMMNSSGPLCGETSIYIMPGFNFKLTNAIITNFHQPSSTLLLIISALIKDQWRPLYKEALAEKYRFLSYGDSSLLWKDS